MIRAFLQRRAQYLSILGIPATSRLEVDREHIPTGFQTDDIAETAMSFPRSAIFLR